MANIPSIVNNEQNISLGTGVTMRVPKVALATSWAVLSILGASSGDTYLVTCNLQAIRLTIGTDGTAKMSLQPFIQQAVKNALDVPLPTDGSLPTAENKWRGILELNVSNNGNEWTAFVPFIYGGANPSYQVTERWLEYIDNGTYLGTWVTLDLAVWYNNDGTLNTSYLNDWQNCNFNLNEWLQTPPTADSVEQVEVAMFNRGRIVFAPMNLNLHYDCRDKDVRLVKWLDAEGRINTRLFTFASESEGGATGTTYNRHHWAKEKVMEGDAYWCGTDKWASRTATKQITLGDENIPQEQFSWIASLVQSACIEIYTESSEGVMLWQRCNITDSNIERDPRKEKFNVTMTFDMPPIYEPQQF